MNGIMSQSNSSIDISQTSQGNTNGNNNKVSNNIYGSFGNMDIQSQFASLTPQQQQTILEQLQLQQQQQRAKIVTNNNTGTSKNIFHNQEDDNDGNSIHFSMFNSLNGINSTDAPKNSFNDNIGISFGQDNVGVLHTGTGLVSSSSSGSQGLKLSLPELQRLHQLKQLQQQQLQTTPLHDILSNTTQGIDPITRELLQSHYQNLAMSKNQLPVVNANGKVKGKSRRELPNGAVDTLKAWLLSPEHIERPYPTPAEQIELMRKTGIDKKQLKNWFTNARRRIWKPLMKKKLEEGWMPQGLIGITADNQDDDEMEGEEEEEEEGEEFDDEEENEVIQEKAINTGNGNFQPGTQNNKVGTTTINGIGGLLQQQNNFKEAQAYHESLGQQLAMLSHPEGKIMSPTSTEIDRQSLQPFFIRSLDSPGTFEGNEGTTLQNASTSELNFNPVIGSNLSHPLMKTFTSGGGNEISSSPYANKLNLNPQSSADFNPYSTNYMGSMNLSDIGLNDTKDMNRSDSYAFLEICFDDQYESYGGDGDVGISIDDFGPGIEKIRSISYDSKDEKMIPSTSMTSMMISGSPKNVNVNVNLITGLKRALSSQDFATVIQKKDARQADIKSYGKNLNKLDTSENPILSSPNDSQQTYLDSGSTSMNNANSPTSVTNVGGNGYASSQSIQNQNVDDLGPIEVSSTSVCAACEKSGIDIQIRPCNHLFHRTCVRDVLTKLASGIPVNCPLCNMGPITSYVFALPITIAPISTEKGSKLLSENMKSPMRTTTEIGRNSEESTDASSASTSSSASNDNACKSRESDLSKISKHVQHMSIDKNMVLDDGNEGV